MCTTITIKNNNKSTLTGRTFDLSTIFSNYFFIAREKGKVTHSFLNKNSNNSFYWNNKYTYVALKGIFHYGNEMTLDGINEKGLSIEVLEFFNGSYENHNNYKNTISSLCLSDYILSNFSNLDELKKSINDLNIVNEKINGSSYGFHYLITEKSGDSLVIEFKNNKKLFFENTLGICANEPYYDFHMENIKPYINFYEKRTSYSSLNINTDLNPFYNNLLFTAPNDFSSKSRFINAYIFKSCCLNNLKNTKDIDLSIFHILNNLSIPKGLFKKEYEAKKVDLHNGYKLCLHASDQILYTQLLLVKDLNNLTFYYSTYDDLSIHKVEFNEILHSNKAFTIK